MALFQDWLKPIEQAGSSLSNAAASLDPTQKLKNKSTITTPNAPPQVSTNTQAPTVQGMPTSITGYTPASAPATPTAAQIKSVGGMTNANGVPGYANQGTQSQNMLMRQLAGQTQGKGPSLAGEQLQQGQQANLAATMAQLASSRGQPNALNQLSAAQQMQGSNATLQNQMAQARTQEQLNAQQTLAGVSNNAINQGLTQRGQDIGVNTNQAGLTQQSNLAQYQGQLQTALQNGQISASQAQQMYAAAVSTAQQNANLQQQTNALNVGAQEANTNAALGYGSQSLSAQQGNANIAQQNIGTTTGIVGGLLNGGAAIGASAMAPGKWQGGEIKYADGGKVDKPSPDPEYPTAQESVPGTGPNDRVTHEQVYQMLCSGGMASAANKYMSMVQGGTVPGKAKVAGDSPKNDTVHAMLSPGEIVVPRSHAQSPESAMEFIANAKDWSKHKPMEKYDEAITHLATAQGMIHRRLKALEGKGAK